MPIDVVKAKPAAPAIFDSSAAIPVKPLGRSCTGSRNTFMANACKRAEAVTAAAIMKYLFFITLSLFL